MMVGNEVTSEPMIEGRRGFQGADTMEKEAADGAEAPPCACNQQRKKVAKERMGAL